MLWLYSEYGTVILVIIEVPAVDTVKLPDWVACSGPPDVDGCVRGHCSQTFKGSFRGDKESGGYRRAVYGRE